MKPENPLDAVFSSSTHVSLIRALLDSREGMSGRAAARVAGVNHQAGALAMGRLEALGVVQRRGAGRTQLLRLSPENVIVTDLLRPLFRAERALWGRLKEDLSRGWGEKIVSAVLFGSMARGDGGVASDWDVLLVARGVTADVQEAVSARREELMRRYGFRLSPLVIGVKDVKKRFQVSDGLLLNVLREGRLLFGRELREFLP